MRAAANPRLPRGQSREPLESRLQLKPAPRIKGSTCTRPAATRASSGTKGSAAKPRPPRQPRMRNQAAQSVASEGPTLRNPSSTANAPESAKLADSVESAGAEGGATAAAGRGAAAGAGCSSNKLARSSSIVPSATSFGFTFASTDGASERVKVCCVNGSKATSWLPRAFDQT